LVTPPHGLHLCHVVVHYTFTWFSPPHHCRRIAPRLHTAPHTLPTTTFSPTFTPVHGSHLRLGGFNVRGFVVAVFVVHTHGAVALRCRYVHVARAPTRLTARSLRLRCALHHRTFYRTHAAFKRIYWWLFIVCYVPVKTLPFVTLPTFRCLHITRCARLRARLPFPPRAFSCSCVTTLPITRACYAVTDCVYASYVHILPAYTIPVGITAPRPFEPPPGPRPTGWFVPELLRCFRSASHVYTTPRHDTHTRLRLTGYTTTDVFHRGPGWFENTP